MGPWYLKLLELGRHGAEVEGHVVSVPRNKIVLCNETSFVNCTKHFLILTITAHKKKLVRATILTQRYTQVHALKIK